MSDKQAMELVRKVGLFGLSDLRKLAPIGDIGYLNAISYYRGNFLRSGLLDAIYHAYCQQFKKYGWTEQHRCSRWRNSDNDYFCPEIGLRYSIDSGD